MNDTTQIRISPAARGLMLVSVRCVLALLLLTGAQGCDQRDVESLDGAIRSDADVMQARADFVVGWSDPHDDVGEYGPSGAIGAYRVFVPEDARLDGFGIVAIAGGTIEMAMYADVEGRPAGLVVGSVSEPVELTTAGEQRADIDDVAIPRGWYWIAVRVLGSYVGLGQHPDRMRKRCVAFTPSSAGWLGTFPHDAQCNETTGAPSIHAFLYTGSGPTTIDAGARKPGREETLVGAARDFGSDALYEAGFVHAIPIELERGGTLDALGIVTRGSEDQIRLALYSDHADEPGLLVAETGPWHVTQAGAQRIDVIDVRLERGRYWLAVRSFDQLVVGASPDSGVTRRACHRSQRFTGPWSNDDSLENFVCSKVPVTNVFAVMNDVDARVP